MADITETTPQGPDRPGPNASQSELEADIACTREHLGTTLAQLVEKFDIKAQAEHTIDDVKDRAAGVVDDMRDQATHALAGARDAVQSVFTRDYDTASAAAVTGPDMTVETDLALRSRPDGASLVPLAIASGLALTAVIVVVVWRR